MNKLRRWLDNLDNDELVNFYKAYVSDTDIFYMKEIGSVLGNEEPWDIAKLVFASENFNPHQRYFWFDMSGKLKSSDNLSGSPINLDTLEKCILNHFYPAELQGGDEIINSIKQEGEQINEDKDEQGE